jgi:ribonuclease Z
MSELIILGSSNAIPSPGHENTHLLISTTERKVLIDCGPNPVVRLEQVGLDANAITDIILTHFHPDHVAGLPLLLMDMWLMGRKLPLNIYGLDYTLERVETMMALYGWDEWPNFFTVNFVHLPDVDGALVLDDEQLRIYSSPVTHFLPNICLRIELKIEKKSVAYSCDTEPSQAVLDISRDANILLHEASGPFTGHSSAAQAGEMAQQAGVGTLYLIHYPTGRFASGDLVSEARTRFSGTVIQALDFMKIDLQN